jgi:hypothetical protein
MSQAVACVFDIFTKIGQIEHGFRTPGQMVAKTG